jgi:acetyltransferase
VAATFSPAIDIDKGDVNSRKQIGIVSQSGGLGFAFFNRGRRDNLEFSHIISVGNQVDLEIAEYVEYLIEQESTKVIMMYLESLKDPLRFLKAAQRAADLGKPIIVAKVGSSKAGRRAAESHTGAIASSAEVVNAVFSHHGILRVEDQDELLNLAGAFIHNPLPKGNRVAIISASGGTAVWLADACEATGFEVPEIDAERRARMAEFIPGYGSTNNPVDITAQGVNGYAKSLQILGEAPYIDAIIIAATFAHERRLINEGKEIAELSRRLGKPVLLYSYTLPSERSRQLLKDLGLHCYTSLQGCVRSLKGLLEYSRFQESRAQRSAPVRERGQMPEAAREILAVPNKVLCEYEAKALLAAYGVKVPEEALARTADEAVAHAEQLGYPVALKLQSPEIPHKTEARAVKLGLPNGKAVREWFDVIRANGAAHVPGADIHGVLVQKMAVPGRELIAGVINDGDFGPMLMVGLGGIYVEVLGDVAIAPTPITHATAHEMLGRLRGNRLLTGVRGEPPKDLDAVADFLVCLSHMAWDARDVLAEFDVNPIFVHDAGAGITVVDALGIKKAKQGDENE